MNFKSHPLRWDYFFTLFMVMNIIVEEKQLKNVALKYLEGILDKFHREVFNWKDFTMYHKNIETGDYGIEATWDPKKKVYFVTVGQNLWSEIQNLFGLTYREVQELFFEYFNKKGVNKVRYVTLNSKDKKFS